MYPKLINRLLKPTFLFGVFLAFTTACEKSELANEEGDVFVSEIKSTTVVPNEVKLFLDRSTNGRSSEVINSMYEVDYKQSGATISATVIDLENGLENSNSSLIFNNNTGQIEFLLEYVNLDEDRVQVNYYSPDGKVLVMQTNGTTEEQEITYFIGEDENLTESPSNSRVSGDWSGRFFGCLTKLAKDETFQVVALAGAIGGYGAYIAAGAAIGCGISALDESKALISSDKIGYGVIQDAKRFNSSLKGSIAVSSDFSLVGRNIKYID